MTHDLHIRWSNIEDPKGHADCLLDILDGLKPDFRQIGVMNTRVDEAKGRFWHKAPTYSEVGKSFMSDIPLWTAVYTEIPVYRPDIYILDGEYQTPQPRGSLDLLFKVPDYQRYMVTNQSALEYMFGRQPHEWKSFDSERLEMATRLLHEALYRIGLHPGGPYPPDEFNWNLGV